MRSVALLADLVHNFGDALTVVPLGIAFALRSVRAERWAGLAVVGAIFVSACVAGTEAVARIIDPQAPDYLPALGLAGVLGLPATGPPPKCARGRAGDLTVRRW
jgi:divalent metal cation (Fe/Co/Zn/Cd) transporter